MAETSELTQFRVNTRTIKSHFRSLARVTDMLYYVQGMEFGNLKQSAMKTNILAVLIWLC